MAHDIGLCHNLYAHTVLIYLKPSSRKPKNLFSPMMT